MMDAASSAVVRYRVASSDPDEAAETMRATYTEFESLPAERRGFEFFCEGVSAGPIDVSVVRHSAPIIGRAEPPERFLAFACLNMDDSRLRLTHGKEDARDPVMLVPSTPYATALYDSRVQVCTVDRDEVARVGAELTGLDPAAVTFHSMTPRTEALGRYWAALVTHLRGHVLAHDDLVAQPLLRAEAVRRLAQGLLAVFPNDVLDRRHAAGADRAEPATVRRAVEFMDANAERDIDITQIAEASGLGPRGLQSAFRRHRDQTPLEYLRRVRMEGAHRDLQAADPTRGDTVAAIAAWWGFSHPGRFSVEYREQFGCSPSTTLRE